MSDLSDVIMNRGMPPTALGPQAQQQPNPLMLLLQRLIMKQQGPANASPSVFDAQNAMQQHNQQLQQALEGR